MEHPRTTKNVGQPCVICGQPANAQATVEALRRERDFFETAAATANRMRVDTERALDAEREKVKAIEKVLDIDSGKTTVEKVVDLKRSFAQVWESYQDAANEMFEAQAQLSQLQALVRAFFTSEDKWAVAYRELERLGYTLDTTTPAEKMKEPQNENDDRQS